MIETMVQSIERILEFSRKYPAMIWTISQAQTFLDYYSRKHILDVLTTLEEAGQLKKRESGNSRRRYSWSFTEPGYTLKERVERVVLQTARHHYESGWGNAEIRGDFVGFILKKYPELVSTKGKRSVELVRHIVERAGYRVEDSGAKGPVVIYRSDEELRRCHSVSRMKVIKHYLKSLSKPHSSGIALALEWIESHGFLPREEYSLKLRSEEGTEHRVRCDAVGFDQEDALVLYVEVGHITNKLHSTLSRIIPAFHLPYSPTSEPKPPPHPFGLCDVCNLVISHTYQLVVKE